MNSEDFVTYEQALALKKLGFREECLYYYNVYNIFSPNLNYEENIDNVNDLLFSHNIHAAGKEVCDAPTLWEAQKWLRKEKGYFVEVRFMRMDAYTYEIYGKIHRSDYTVYPTPEEALSAGITECIKLLENK